MDAIDVNEKQYSPTHLRVIALAAAVESTSTYDLPADDVYPKVIAVADKFHDWLTAPAKQDGLSTEASACPRCLGCGQLADSDDREPWSAWANLPTGSDVAVRMGLVKPIPCDECGGSGAKDAS